MVGDAATDIAGKSVGCKTALITPSQEYREWMEKSEICAESLAQAAREILGPGGAGTERATGFNRQHHEDNVAS
jgi:hypothetical protein